MYTPLARKLIGDRQATGKNGKEVCEELGIPRHYLSQLENGILTKANSAVLPVLAYHYGVDLDSYECMKQEELGQYYLDARSVGPSHRELARTLVKYWLRMSPNTAARLQEFLKMEVSPKANPTIESYRF